jgi:hypothetical protein
LFVAERDQGQHGVVEPKFFGAGGVRGAGGFPGGGDADLVLEFYDDALGGLFADAFDFGKSSDVARDHRRFK